jgi:hypothetical protein
LQKAWGETPITTQDIGGQTVASRTLDASGVQGYGKWGGGTDGGVNGKPLSQNYILPQGALDFKFAQSNAPLSNAQRNSSFNFGGSYSNARAEKSPTRFTSSDLNLGMANNRSVSGGLADFTTGETFLPSGGGYGSSYSRFGGSPASYTDRNAPTFTSIRTPQQVNSNRLDLNQQQSQWNDEWAQGQGFKNYQEYLNRK